MKKNYISVPNILSFYRILTFPLVLYYALINREGLFFILLVTDFITDILDGFIARKFKLETEFGAKLDALADIGMYILAFAGIICFKIKEIEPYSVSFSIFLGVFLLPKIITLVRFRKFPSLHLYSSKIGGYLQGFFFLFLFIYGFSVPFYYVMITVGIISFIEQILIVSIVPILKSDVKGLFWVLKEKNS